MSAQIVGTAVLL